MTAWVVAVLAGLLRLGAALWAVALAIVVVGALAPRLPVVGFLGSFVTGQYPLHALLAAVTGLGLALGVWGVGSRGLGAAVGAVSAVAVAGLVVVLLAQLGVVRGEGVRFDPLLALAATDQGGVVPDRTERFSTDPALDLDLYLPPGPGPHPVMVWAHGGSWVRGERTDRAAAHRWLADRGVAVATLTYRLPPPNGAGAGQRRDVACALGWVRDHATQLGLDPSRVSLGGQSAGATLALGTASALVAGEPLCGTPVAPPVAVAAFYPVVDMTAIDPSLQDAVLGGPADRFPDRLTAASPDRQVRPGLPPTLLVLGAADHYVYPDRVRAYDAALRGAGVPGRLLEVPYADHVFDFPFGSPGAQVARPVLRDFLLGSDGS